MPLRSRSGGRWAGRGHRGGQDDSGYPREARPALREDTGKGAGTDALESLVIAGFVRSLSVRGVEATLADALGPEAALSKSTVSRACRAIKDDYDGWAGRSLADVELDYLFLDGSQFKYHQGSKAEPLLAASGIKTDGKPGRPRGDSNARRTV